MDYTSQATAESSDDEDSHSACQSQSAHVLVPESSRGLTVPRGITLASRSLQRSGTRDVDQSSNLTLLRLIDRITNISSDSQDGSNGGSCPRPSLHSILHRHMSIPRFHPGVPYVIQRSLLPHTQNSPSQSRPALTYPTSDQVGDRNEAEMDHMVRQYEESVLYMLRLLDRFLEGSRSLLISQANNGVNFRLVSEEHSNRFRNQSLMFYVTERQDHYRDMRVDVDNMSYEELLALEDHMGYVSTGLSEGAVTESLKHSKYFLLAKESGQKESCTICQEEYVEEDDLGSLDCGHGFHTACIRQWLRYKNLCPVCKSTGLCAVNPSFLQIHNNL